MGHTSADRSRDIDGVLEGLLKTARAKESEPETVDNAKKRDSVAVKLRHDAMFGAFAAVAFQQFCK